MIGVELALLATLTLGQFDAGGGAAPAQAAPGGSSLRSPVQTQLKPKSYDVNIYASRNVKSTKKIVLSLASKNVRTVPIAIYRLDGSQLVSASHEPNWKPKPSGAPFKSIDVDVAQKSKVLPGNQDTYYERNLQLPSFGAGLYYIEAKVPGHKSWALVNVTDIAVVIKRAPRKALVWVVDANTGKVVPNAPVSVYEKGQVVASGKTGADGTFLCKVANDQTSTALAKRNNEMAVAGAWSKARDGEVTSHLQFDRPIYRPGHEVQFKAILRVAKGIGYEPLSNAAIKAEIQDPNGMAIERLNLTTNTNGTIHGTFKVPSEGALGEYTVYLEGANVEEYDQFSVQEYRKPEFKVALTADKKRYLAGEEIKMKVSSEYYFGAKTPRATVQYVVRRSSIAWRDPDIDFSFGNSYANDVFAANGVVTTGIAIADKNGDTTIAVKTTPESPDAEYVFEVTVSDASRRQVTSSSSVNVFGANVRVQVRPMVGYVPKGRLFPVEVRLTDLDGAPVSGNVRLSLHIDRYSKKESRYVQTEIDSTTIKVPPTGLATVQLPAKEGPYLTIKAKSTDSTGRNAISISSIYVASPFSDPESTTTQPEVGIKLDRKSYAPGETAKGFVRTNREKRPMLVTLEGDDLFNYRVLTGSQAASWKLDPSMSPNASVDVVQWNEFGATSGHADIAIFDPTRKLQVKVIPEKAELAPGDPARYTIQTLDSAGKPVSAEVAFGVVDEAIYAIQSDGTADVVDTFWGPRESRVSTANSSPLEMAGGAFQNMKASVKKEGAPVRSRFVDTAYWNAVVMTDASGQAKIEYETPGNLTAWRATARAINPASQVGLGQSITRASRPLTLRLATPRQMTVGDDLQLIASVSNRTKSDETLTVAVTTNGVLTKRQVSVPAGGEAKAMFPIPADKAGRVTMLGELLDSSGTRQDALEVSVPVVPAGIKSRYATSGIADGQVSLELPSNRDPDGATATLKLFAGSKGLVSGLEESIMDAYRYSPLIAAAQMRVIGARKLPWSDTDVRETLAMLGRTRQNEGWGWFDESPADPVVTARVLSGLAEAGHLEDAAELRDAAKNAGEHQYRRQSFPEYRAMLVEALAKIGSSAAPGWISEVDDKSETLSPTARLALANALMIDGKRDRARSHVTLLTRELSRGASETYLPVGRGIGWVGSTLEANARLLKLLVQLDLNRDDAHKIANWLSNMCNRWSTPTDSAAIADALRAYGAKFPSPSTLDGAEVTVDGKPIALKFGPDRDWATASVPVSGSKVEANVSFPGAAKPRFLLEANVYLPVAAENSDGVRTLFRWEVQNSAGAWEEVDRAIRPNEPVRCTAVVWGDSVTDAVKVTLPIPAGFEVVDQERAFGGHAEVRDGTMIYFTTLSNGLPSSFRFFLRAESDGELVVPSAYAEIIRRPDQRGYSRPMRVTVRE